MLAIKIQAALLTISDREIHSPSLCVYDFFNPRNRQLLPGMGSSRDLAAFDSFPYTLQDAVHHLIHQTLISASRLLRNDKCP
jgi:hypothetical protein